MGIVTFKTLNKEKDSDSDVILQITKRQVLVFFRFLFALTLITINAIALYIESPFIKELLISQTILLMVFFIKSSISNTIKK